MRSSRVQTDRLALQVHESGPEDGVPIDATRGLRDCSLTDGYPGDTGVTNGCFA